MSFQRGNSNRTRPQKYKNQHAFKNDLHDKTVKTKFINNLQVANVCERCKKIIEWKIKYKKYKPLKSPAKCTKCSEKTVKHAYHIMCLRCSKENDVCPKCGEKGPVLEGELSLEETMKLDADMQLMLKSLPERKRRTFLRYMSSDAAKKDGTKTLEIKGVDSSLNLEEYTEDRKANTKHDLIQKLKQLSVNTKENDSDAELDDPDESNYTSDDSDKDNM
ncbi:uncharacterized protein [Prorops nasuta]|uniref:uncharacterized protein n=1 Tax=Prorops nasuta TaxID=863751 RepID=UPI0034CFC8D9